MAAQRVESALLEPYSSIGSANVTQGPFIDTQINDPRFGRVYLDRLQAWDIAKATVDLLDANQKNDLVRLAGGASWDEVETLGEQVAALSAQLALERDSKVVPLAEVVDFFAEREKRRPDAAVPSTQPQGVA